MTLTLQAPPGLRQPDILPLREADIPHLRLRRHVRFDADDIRAILATNPGSSFWIPETDELIVVGNWRHRSDIHAIHALSAMSNETRLIEQAADHAAALGISALLTVDSDEMRRPAFYAKHHLSIIDRIATFELPSTRLGPVRVREDIAFRRIERDDIATLVAVEALDHQAFPWFWWNVRDEFAVYTHLPDVEIHIGVLEGHLVSYIGITHYPGWGHLDRIATAPDMQRSGIGAATLEHAIRVLRQRGARRIALSTQGGNESAQRLYIRRGFLRTPTHDYTVHGRILHPERFGPVNATRQERAIGGTRRTEHELIDQRESEPDVE